MQVRRLGNSGAVVTAWCLGTMTFGDEADEATSFAMMDLYAEAGGNFLDTANVYSRGKSETIVGRWLKARPDAARPSAHQPARRREHPAWRSRRRPSRCGRWGPSL